MMTARDRLSRSDRVFSRPSSFVMAVKCKICRCGYEIICHGALIYHSWWELFALDLQRTSLFQQWRMKAMHLEVQLILSDNLVAFWSVKMKMTESSVSIWSNPVGIISMFCFWKGLFFSLYVARSQRCFLFVFINSQKWSSSVFRTKAFRLTISLFTKVR